MAAHGEGLHDCCRGYAAGHRGMAAAAAARAAGGFCRSNAEISRGKRRFELDTTEPPYFSIS